MKLKIFIAIYLLGYVYSVAYGYFQLGFFSDRVFMKAVLWPIRLVMSF